jgi:hypothetical protein
VEQRRNEDLKMNVRELLQIEIWSKRTTRKICIGIGIVFVGFVSWVSVEQQWLTPGERSAARAALVQIDALQNLSSISDEDFKARAKQAEGKVETAKRAAWTSRDKIIYSVLYAYVSGIELQRDRVQVRKLEEQRHILLSNSDREFEEKLDSSGKEGTQFVRSVLHRALD